MMKLAGAILFLLVMPAMAQHTTPQEQALHEKFYSHWERPSKEGGRVGSCCGGQDCAPAEFRRHNGHWEAKRSYDHDYIIVPDWLIESNLPDPYDSPDTNGHLCASIGYAPNVYCAVLGAGL